MSEVATGLCKPRPPNLAGNAKRSLLRSLGGGWPVRDGISLDLMMFLRIEKRCPTCGIVRERNNHLLECPWQKAAKVARGCVVSIADNSSKSQPHWSTFSLTNLMM